MDFHEKRKIITLIVIRSAVQYVTKRGNVLRALFVKTTFINPSIHPTEGFQ